MRKHNSLYARVQRDLDVWVRTGGISIWPSEQTDAVPRQERDQSGLAERLGTDMVRCSRSSVSDFGDPAALSELPKSRKGWI